MKLSLVFPTLPPALDGIGDYTARLAAAFSGLGEVTVHTASPGFEEIEGVRIVRSFSVDTPTGIRGLEQGLLQSRPDWVVLQYNPFSYGPRGFNLTLPKVLKRVKRKLPGARLAVMVHEPFVPVDGVKNLVMTLWQRWQLWQLGRAADLMYFTIESWVERFSRWFSKTPVYHLQVGSNVPRIPSNREETRRQLGISDDEFVAGIFGTLHPSRLMHFVGRAIQEVKRAGRPLTILYIGPHGSRAAAALEDARVIDAGKLPPADVSRYFQAMDMYLAPFRKGVSARRGSFLVGIQHGIATVSTHGIHTDSFIRKADEAAFLLASDKDSNAFANCVKRMALDDELRQNVAAAGEKFFGSHFSWSGIAGRQYSDMSSFEGCDSRINSDPVLQSDYHL